ncbi:MAG: hypothetical protein D3916_07450, partial [Candidatus Electrothrix sp. MAN1_4]|nr:hypothetical protein [Candidatus Electrothrix sp. MAN1_4]
MKPLAQLSWQLPDPTALQEQADALKEKYSVQNTPAQTTSLRFYDSFDWRLYSDNLLCFEQGNKLYLTDLAGRELTPCLPLVGQEIGFPQNLPSSSLRQKVAPVLEMRTLLLQSSFMQTSQQICVLNKDEKTVARITLSELHRETTRNEHPICSIQLHQVRGYDKWFQRLEQDLKKLGTAQPCTKEQDLKNALAM